MNIYKISQSVNNDYDTYDSAVAIAANEQAARETHPASGHPCGKWTEHHWVHCAAEWTYRSDVTVELIGEAAPGSKPGVVVASFNAG